MRALLAILVSLLLTRGCAFAGDVASGQSTVGAQLPAGTAAWTSATANNTALTLTVKGFGTAVVTYDGGVPSGGLLDFEVSADGSTWYSTTGCRIDLTGCEALYAMTSTARLWQFGVAGVQAIRVRYDTTLGAISSGTANIRLQASGEPFTFASLAQHAMATSIPVVIASNQSDVGVNVDQAHGTTLDTNSGNKSNGTPRFVIATDQPQLTNALKVDPSAVTSPISIAPVTTSGNALTGKALASVTTSVNVKASAGNVYGVFALNGAASTCWLQFINSAGAGTLGSGIVFAVPLPASTTTPIYLPPSDYALSNFSTGIAVGIATTATGGSACGTAGNLTVFYE